MTTDLKREVKKLQSDLRKIKKEVTPKVTLVKASTIMKLTGWNKDAMYRNRLRGVIQFHKQGRKIDYILESIPQQLIKQVA